MLTRVEIQKIAIKYMLQIKAPIIISSCRITMPEEEENLESKKYMRKMNVALVVFTSKNADDEFDPGIFMIYVNIENGAVTFMAPM